MFVHKMPLRSFILLFLRQASVDSLSTSYPTSMTTLHATTTSTTASSGAITTAAASSSTATYFATTSITTTSSDIRLTETTEGTLPSPELVAIPDYPVAAGQIVSLRCTSATTTSSVTWSWKRQENQNWTVVESGRDLTLTKPEQSGLYRCLVQTGLSQERASPQHPVYIVSVHSNAGENLGIAALCVSLLAFIFSLAILLWLYLERRGLTLTASDAVFNGPPGFENSPKEGLPKTDREGDVYMNYAGTNPAYSDLDPSRMTMDNLYSSLS